MTYDISSPSNERIKALVRLKQRRERDATGTFLIEGLREVSRALDAGRDIIELFVCTDFGGDGIAADVPATTLSREAFQKASQRQNPDGILALAKQWATDLDAIVLSEVPLVLVAEAIEKPGNLGAMLRVADAAGLDAVVVCDPVVDIFNPNVVRASQGSVFSVPVAIATSDDVMMWLVQAHLLAVATFPDAETVYSTVDLTPPAAIVVGAESTGLSERWRSVATPASIPMAGSADSLNAATSAAIVIYEAVRQRTAS